MKKSNVLLWLLIFLFVGLIYWTLSTGKFESTVGLFINGIWDSIEKLIRPIFHR